MTTIMKKKDLYADSFRNRILSLLDQQKDHPLTLEEIAGALEVRHGARKHVRAVLERMTLAGDVVRVRENRYAPGKRLDLVTGSLQVARSGDGFVSPADGGRDVLVARGTLGTALPGDRVVVRLNRAAPGSGVEDRRTGVILRIEERARRALAGTLKATKNFFYVVPIDPAYTQDFYVPDPKGAKVGDRVVIQFVEWANKHVNPEAEIVEVIGPADQPSLDTLTIIRHYGFAEEFSPDALREAGEAARLLDEPGPREDLRERYIITVDPARARDFDDAISLERDDRGRRVLGVHIADVSHFVRPGSALDTEARERGTSVYFPDRVLPMLPEVLSNGLCSLRPDEDRFAFSVFIAFDDEGVPVDHRFARSVIRSRHRLTYEQALLALEAPAGQALPDAGLDARLVAFLQEVGVLAQQLRRRRFGFHALDLDLPEYEIVIGPDAMIQDMVRRVNDPSHQLIEECMVAANEAVDRELSAKGHGLLHRVHEPPAPAKIEELTARLKEMGFTPGDLGNRANLAAFLRTVRGHAFEYDAQMAVLRSLKRAVYSPQALGHFGLAKKYYAHFTSPIRRYPDLVVHRILAAALEGRRHPYAPHELAALAQGCSRTEQDADAAEKALIEIKKYRFLEQVARQEPPRLWDAVVVHAANFGLFVELTDLQVQGLIHISALSPGYVQYDAHQGALRAGSTRYARGTRLRVRVSRVDFDKRQIDFVLADRPDAPAQKPVRGKHHPERPRDSDVTPSDLAQGPRPHPRRGGEVPRPHRKGHGRKPPRGSGGQPTPAHGDSGGQTRVQDSDSHRSPRRGSSGPRPERPGPDASGARRPFARFIRKQAGRRGKFGRRR
jgi:ribonuclease R